MSKIIGIKPLGYVVISAALLITVFLVISAFSPRDENRGFRYFINRTIGAGCVSYNQQVFSRRLKDMLPDYIAESSRSGIPRCRDKSELMKKVSSGDLHRIRDGRGYEIVDLTYSYPYLTGDGKELLREIGKRFRQKLRGTRLRGSDFLITSMTRTSDILLRLRQSNSNASLNSPHFNGNTFDISYMRFSSRKWFTTDCDKAFMKEALAEVIWQLRQENRCWATYEVKQSCFHVVAR